MSLNRSIQIGPAKFGIAVHALIWLAQSGGTLSSAAIASQVNSHATFLRRVLALLVHSGIVEAKEGRDGGYFLKRCPNQISLADVFMAVKSECGEQDMHIDCGTAGKQIDARLEAIMEEVQWKTVTLLKQYTLDDVMKDIDFTN
ncbi:Rrf2 family transcriptional regulator [Paenibacillus sp. Soil522]|uniref:Rrf2 family transcriptional regulator n=1 Tax=Paenibacillus sp. Soil522 TaxID=1736388 RepID=UPI0006FBDC6E|nr:Rrf2 family transcriptional regulator [Paenibacillus sp. Soil522]KRE44881.1 Rrf2 family transcriptional regulator [Paenibacillus sp. Soil522]